MENIEQYIEALIFASEQGIRTEEIMYCLQASFEHDYTADEITKQITDNITQKYLGDAFAIEVVKINNGLPVFNQKEIPRRYKPAATATF
jgi:segregation and condensation protein B